MSRHRTRSLIIALVVLIGVWILAGAGYSYFKGRRVTGEKVVAYLNEVDLSKLAGAQRASALRELADQLNALPFEERRRARMDARFRDWFDAMTDPEKSAFIEATMPTGFKQMLGAFEKLPEDKRRKAVIDAIRDLKRAREELAVQDPAESPFRLGTNRPPVLSEELQQKMVQLGLKSFYNEASAATKAEVAPLLEELQRAMESGRLFRMHQ